MEKGRGGVLLRVAVLTGTLVGNRRRRFRRHIQETEARVFAGDREREHLVDGKHEWWDVPEFRTAAGRRKDGG